MFRLFIFSALIMFNQRAGSRVLEVYSDSFTSPKFQEEMRLLHDDDSGLKERDIRVVQIIRAPATEDRFKQNHVKGNFAVLLYGKDGGIKHRTTEVLTASKLFAIVDAMPMRKLEMRTRKRD
jgi:hypothetical protein